MMYSSLKTSVLKDLFVFYAVKIHIFIPAQHSDVIFHPSTWVKSTLTQSAVALSQHPTAFQGGFTAQVCWEKGKHASTLSTKAEETR